MSLQVWLPLNGNLDNQGLSDISVTNYGATVDNSGKIGKCYSFDGTNDYLQITNYHMSNLVEYSIACWVYPTSDVDYLFLVRGNGQHQIHLSGDGLMFRDTKNSSQRIVPWNYTFMANTWTHICCTYKLGEIFLYCNGVQTNHNTLYTHSNSQTNANNTEIRIGRQQSSTSDSYFSGKINDFRIYNHALSLKEIKEISKGLVLHYPLDDKYIESTTNLCNGLIAGGRTTVINNTIVNTGANADTYWYIKPKKALVGGATYTVSCCLSGFSSNSTYISWGVCAQSGANSAGSWKCYNGHNEFTFTMPSNLDGSTAKIIFDDNGGTRTEIFTISQIQLEKKDHATGYAGIGGIRNSTIVYDCSGYQNNGTIINLSCSNDTIKNQSSTSFDGNTSVIQLGNISSLLQNTFTMNLWFKKSELGSKAYETLFGGPSGFEIDTRAGSSSTLSLYMTPKRGGNAFSPFNFNQWYMVTMVNDGTNELYYINGELKKTIEKKSMPNGNYFIGSWSRATSQNYKGLISDFRLYTTPLSEEDILQLYHISVIADRNGKLNTYQYNEQDNKKQFLKQNISKFENYYELQAINPNIMPNSVTMALGSASAASGTWRLTGTSRMTRSRVLIEDSPIGECYGFQSSGIQSSTINDTSCYGIDSFPFQANTDYVISFYARKTAGVQAYAGFSIYRCTYKEGSYIRLQQQYYITPLLQSGEWIRCWQHIVTNSSTNRNIYIGITTGTQSATAQICAVKIEKGTLPSEWQPKETDENYEQYRIKDNTITINRQNCIFANSFYEI